MILSKKTEIFDSFQNDKTWVCSYRLKTGFVTKIFFLKIEFFLDILCWKSKLYLTIFLNTKILHFS